jgi:hypothetical protein
MRIEREADGGCDALCTQVAGCHLQRDLVNKPSTISGKPPHFMSKVSRPIQNHDFQGFDYQHRAYGRMITISKQIKANDMLQAARDLFLRLT